MSGLSALAARKVRDRVVGDLTARCSGVVNAVERLCDRDLGDAERLESTDGLYDAVAEMRGALDELVDLAGGARGLGGADVVVHISRSRFRSHRWGRLL